MRVRLGLRFSLDVVGALEQGRRSSPGTVTVTGRSSPGTKAMHVTVTVTGRSSPGTKALGKAGAFL